MRKRIKAERNENMYRAFTALRTPEEFRRFLDDLCSLTELHAMEQRFEVACLLQQGFVYTDILAKTGASSATISRVNRSLSGGAGGYQIVFDRMGISEEQQQGEG